VGAVILNPWSSSSHFWLSMYALIVASSTAPTVAQKYPRAHMCWPQYRFRSSGNSACRCRLDRPLMYCASFDGDTTGGRRHQQMYVIRRHRAPYDHHVPRLADLPDQIARSLCHAPAQYFVAIFRTPDQVILQIVDRVRAMSVFRHFPYSRAEERAAES
jgi:hypothetical protein